MSLSSITRYAHHTDAEHAAREHGFNSGYDQANFAEAYGVSDEFAHNGPQVPDRFRHQENVWLEAFQEGQDEYAAVIEDEEAYGHDYHERTNAWDAEDLSADLGC